MRLTQRQSQAVNQIIQEDVDCALEGRSMVPEIVGRAERLEEDVDFPELNEGDLIAEEYLHGVPEWKLREDTTDFVNVIRKRIKAYILLNKSENGADQRAAIGAANDVCDELEEKVYDLLEDQLFSFTRRV